MLEPQRDERAGNGRTEAQSVCSQSSALLLRVERCLLGLARLVDSGPARFNNTDQRIVIQNNKERAAAAAVDEAAETRS